MVKFASEYKLVRKYLITTDITFNVQPLKQGETDFPKEVLFFIVKFHGYTVGKPIDMSTRLLFYWSLQSYWLSKLC